MIKVHSRDTHKKFKKILTNIKTCILNNPFCCHSNVFNYKHSFHFFLSFFKILINETIRRTNAESEEEKINFFN